jgi:hypothetical protein
MDITKVSSRELSHGHVTVGITRTQLSVFNFPLLKGVLLRAPGGDDPVANSDPVWVGGAGVTANSAATGGLPLVPGASIFIPVEDPSLLWVVSTATSQDIAWIGI